MIKKEGLGDSDSNRAKGSEELIGKIIDQRYRIENLLDPTRKSWVFSAREVGEISPGRDVALKVLKPGQEPKRKEQFAEEAKTLADLESHPNIATVYGGGRDEKYFYIAMELVPGDNLKQRVNSRETFSLERIVNLSHSLAEAVDFCHSYGIEHNDIKLKNLKEKEGEKGTCAVLDFGSKFTRDRDSDDVYAMGNILKELLDHRQDPEKKVPRGLEQIVNKSTSAGYASPEDFKDAIKSYKKSVKRGITRRKFLKIGLGGLVLSGLGYSGYKYLDYKNSIDCIAEEIAQTEASDYEKIDPLFKELAFRIFDKKIRWLVESGKILRGKFPYATIENGSWFLTEGGYWTEGFWPGILWNAYEVTREERYKQWAAEWTRAIDFTERESNDIRSIRFYYSHAKAFELTGDEFFRNEALKAAEFMASRFNDVGDYLQMFGSINQNLMAQTIELNSIILLPILWFAYEKSKDYDKEKYYDIVYDHLQAVLEYNIREDYSVCDFAIFNPEEDVLIREQNYFGYSPDSCLSRGQARAIRGFTLAYKKTKDQNFLLTAERLANYFIDNLPEDFVPFYDFDDPNKDIPKDSSAAAIASSALLDLYRITSNERYRKIAYNMLKSLSSRNYLSTDLRNYQGIIMHGCYNKHEGYTDSSLIFGDYSFLESLKKVK